MDRTAAASATRVVASEALPFAPMGTPDSGVEMKLLRISLEDERVTFLNRFAPGFRAPTHRHLGEVHAYTLSGRWRYLEYDWESREGDYVFEPPDTVHTLDVPAGNPGPTVVLFVVHRGMELFTPEGTLLFTQTIPSFEDLYRSGLEQLGLPFPKEVLR